MALNLAPYFYRNVYKKKGGPVSDFAFYDFKDEFEVYTQICEDLLQTPKTQNVLYGNFTGTGTGKSFLVAKHKSISEALERWAFFSCMSNRELMELYGFDVNPTTTGMAAFPGFTTKSARQRAFCEAVERWGLMAWWNGECSAKVIYSHLGEQVVRILTPFKEYNLVVTLKKIIEGQYTSYGFACRKNLHEAITAANIERNRNEVVIGKFYKLYPEQSELSLNESRLIFFASSEGRELFDRRVHLSENLLNSNDLPLILIDREIFGPWTRYTKVWRVLFESRCKEDESKLNVFLF